jgi:hypothetical protein
MKIYFVHNLMIYITYDKYQHIFIYLVNLKEKRRVFILGLKD